MTPNDDTSATPWSVGLMTGTVLDGNIDVALLRTDGTRILDFGPWDLIVYEPGVLQLLERALEAARKWAFEGPEPDVFARAERALTDAQGDAVRQVLAAHRIAPADVAVIGFHGQSVLHRAPLDGNAGRTRQLGDGARMAARLGIDVVADLRANDVAAGGHGAPLCPVYHRALLERVGGAERRAFLNIGGVANLTWCGGGALVAFDTGPGNAPIDDWMRATRGEAMDRDGRLAARGAVDEARVSAALAHPWFARPAPKSLDRFDFGTEAARGLSPADGAATLTAITAASVARALEHLPGRAEELVIGGGGRGNPTLLDEIRRRAGVTVSPAEAVGLRGDAIEAECFAFLAARSLAALPLSYPTTTGVAKPTTGGVPHRARHAPR